MLGNDAGVGASTRGCRCPCLQRDEQARASAHLEQTGTTSVAEQKIAGRTGMADKGRPADRFIRDVIASAWKVKIRTQLDDELETKVRESAEAEATRVFARNLRDLLLAAPAGPRTTIGLDPGLRTGVKVAVVDATGKVVEKGLDVTAEAREPSLEGILECMQWQT